jgi:HK97 family phage prohead protease
MFETKDFAFEVKATSDNTFEGYASVFNNVDSHNDIIQKGAFAKTIQESKRVKVLWQHDITQPIGKPLAMSEDSKGLHVKAKISDTALGRDVVQLMKDGVIDELSIGFKTVKDSWDKKSRLIHEVQLFEFSPVTFASNAAASIVGVKGLSPELTRLNSWVHNELKNGTMLDSEKKDLLRNAIEAMTALLDASEEEDKPGDTHLKSASEEEKAAEKNILSILDEMKTLKL